MRASLAAPKAVALRIGMLFGSAAALSGPVYAQGAAQVQAQAPIPPAGSDTIAPVVVVGQRPVMTTSIDRRTYTVSRDLQGATGSISDVLGNLPSVAVDLHGNISLRGQTGVQVLIDGKPSVTVNGANRATTLQQMPANMVESIEVMTNPSAEFKPDGSAGIINIVTKKARAPGVSGSIRAVAGSEGRGSVAASLSRKTGRMNVFGNLNGQRNRTKRVVTRQRTQTDSITSAQRRISQDGTNTDGREALSGSIGLDYDPTAKDRISASVNYSENRSSSVFFRRLINDGPAALLDYDRVGTGSGANNTTGASANYRHSFSSPGQEVRLDLQWGQSGQRSGLLYTNTYRSPAAASSQDDRRTIIDDRFLNLSADYVLPLSDGMKLKVGYNFQDGSNDRFVYGGRVDSVTGVSISLPTVTNRFVYGETIHALYATYQRPFGRWTALGGLRAEQAIIDTSQITSNLVDHSNYFRLYPSLHLQYDLKEGQKLRFSYSHRLTRPSGEDLNPFVTYDEFEAYAGNPRLKPQDSHALEAGWEYQKGGRSILATLYMRRNYNGFTYISTVLSPTVLLITPANLGKSTSGGLDLATTGKLGEALSYSLSGNVSYSRFDTSGLALAGRRSAIGYNARSRIDYRITSDDMVQLTVNYTGRRLMAQGYMSPSSSLNLGYQHKIRQDLILVATVSDLFRSGKSETVLEGPLFRDVAAQQPLGRTVSVSITKQLGGRPVQEGQFEYVR